MGSRFDGRRGWCILAGLVFAHILLAAYGALVHCPVMDEVAHLPAGISHWRFGHFDLYKVDPPLVRMVAVLPVLAVGADEDWKNIAEDGVHWRRPEFLVGFDFARRNGKRLVFLVQIARLVVLPLSVIALVVCYVWSRELYGPVPGLVSAALWAFCPNVLAFTPVVTPDVGGAALGILAVFLAWRWSQRRRWPRALAAGTSLGLALLSRSVWLILFVVLPTLWSLDRRKQDQRVTLQFIQAVSILLIGLGVLNAGYGFERPFASLGSFEFTSDLLTGEENSQAGTRHPGNVFAASVVRRLPVPLPANFVQGVDLQRREVELRPRCFLAGQWRSGGWWYYYLYASAVKLPIGTLLLFGLALTLRVVKGRQASVSDELFLLVPAIALIVLLSVCTGLNRYFRYVIPALPFLYIWASSASASLNGSKAIACSFVLLVASVVSCLRVVPHTMSYFNELAGGPVGGRHHLVDANIDWGQDLLFLNNWLDEHGRDRKVHLAYFGTLEPEIVGLRYELPPFGPVDEFDGMLLGATDLGPQPGLHAVSVNFLMGYEASAPNGSGGHMEVPAFRYSYFEHFTPVAMAGYSIYVYDITLAEANRVRRKLGLPTVASE